MILPNSAPVDANGSFVLPRGTDELSSMVIAQSIDSTNTQVKAVVAAYNQMLSDLKNVGQLVPITFPAVSISGGDSIQLGNFRIPQGASVSVVNACVSSTPVAGAALLNVVYSAGTFGSTGTGQVPVVTTRDEVSPASTKLGTGELVFSVTNTATSKVAVTVSILLALY